MLPRIRDDLLSGICYSDNTALSDSVDDVLRGISALTVQDAVQYIVQCTMQCKVQYTVQYTVQCTMKCTVQ